MMGSPAPTHLPSRYCKSMSKVVPRALATCCSHSMHSRGADTTGRRMNTA